MEHHIDRKNSGVLYKHIVGNAAKHPEMDINDILRRGFDPRNSGGRISGVSVAERALKIMSRFPGRVSVNVVKDIVKYSYDLGLIHMFMTKHPGVMTNEDLQETSVTLHQLYHIANRGEDASRKLKLIEDGYYLLKDTPVHLNIQAVAIVDS